MLNCTECRDKLEPPDIIKCTYCSSYFHYKCAAISKTALKIINDSENIFWVCNGCKRFPSSQVINMLEEQMNLLKHHDVLIRQLCGNVNLNADDRSNTPGVKSLYSTSLKSSSAVIVKPKNHMQRNTETKADILHEVNPVDENINISSVKNIKQGGIVVGCQDENDISKFKNIINEKLGDKYVTTEVKGISPRIRVVGLSEDYEEESLVNHLKHQNKDCFNENSVISVIKCYATKKNNRIFQAILQIDVNSYNKIISVGMGRLLVGYDICGVYDYINIKRCFKCNNYNHFSRDCKKEQTCPRCAGPHELRNCKESCLKCVNCFDLKTRNNDDKIDFRHAVWDQSKCFVYRQKVDEFKTSMYVSK